jgi:hypothetical protein
MPSPIWEHFKKGKVMRSANALTVTLWQICKDEGKYHKPYGTSQLSRLATL